MEASSVRIFVSLICILSSIAFAGISLCSWKIFPWYFVDSEGTITVGLDTFPIEIDSHIGVLRSTICFSVDEGPEECESEWLSGCEGESDGCDECVQAGNIAFGLMIGSALVQTIYLVAYLLKSCSEGMADKLGSFVRVAFIPVLVVAMACSVVSCYFYQAECPDYFEDSLRDSGYADDSIEKTLGAGWYFGAAVAVASFVSLVAGAYDILKDSSS